jgi:hypothetical protein
LKNGTKEHRTFRSLFEQPKTEEAASLPNTEKPKHASFWELFSAPAPQEESASEEIGSEAEAPSSALRFNRKAVFWAMRDLPLEEAPKHFMICGATGSGKSLAIELFLQSIVPRFQVHTSEPEQLILFDAKCDAVSLLANLGLRPEDDHVYILNPYDARSAVWHLSEAVQNPGMARNLATLMVPEEPQASARYFSDAARELVYLTILGLNRATGTDWSFRDLLCALDSRQHIAAVTAQDPRAGTLASRILNDTYHSPGVLSTLGTKVGPFEQVAALWHTNHSGRRFSIPKFLSQPGVLILGNDPVLRESFWPINAILLKQLTQQILRGPNTFLPRHWFVLDEFRAMERVDCIHDLLNRGRSKGASVLLGLQSVEGLETIYRAEATNDLLSQCAYKTFLRAGGPGTAQWAEHFFGRVRCMETVVTETSGESHSTSRQHHVVERSFLIGSFFLDMPFTGPGQPYAAVCDVPCLRTTFIVRRPFELVNSWRRKADSADSWTVSSHEIMNWTALASALKEPQDSVSVYVQSRLANPTRQALASWLETELVSPALQALVIDDFNKILKGGCIFDRQRFSAVELRMETERLAENEPATEESVRLNRMLLEDTYPTLLARANPEGVPSVVPRLDPRDQIISPWTPEEENRYCGLPKGESAATSKEDQGGGDGPLPPTHTLPES